MNWADYLEQTAISAGIPMIFMAIKDPVKFAHWKTIFLHIADGIYVAAGIVPPGHE